MSVLTGRQMCGREPYSDTFGTGYDSGKLVCAIRQWPLVPVGTDPIVAGLGCGTGRLLGGRVKLGSSVLGVCC